MRSSLYFQEETLNNSQQEDQHQHFLLLSQVLLFCEEIRRKKWEEKEKFAMSFNPECILRIAKMNANIKFYKQIHNVLKEIYSKNLLNWFASHNLLNYFYHSHFYTTLPNFCEFYHYFQLPLLPQLEKPLPYIPVPLGAIGLTSIVNSTWSKTPTFLRYIIEHQREGSMSFEHVIHFSRKLELNILP